MIQSRHPIARVALVMAVVLALFSLSSARARGATTASISLKPAVGPPTIPFSVKGQGFGASEVVDLTFDATLIGQATTSPTGSFTKMVKAPRTATPGTHTVTATGETSGESAEASFLVRTNWPRYHFDNANTGFNPYENVLSPATVGGLVEKWAVSLEGTAAPDPIVAYGRVYVVPTDGIVRALDPATGALLWSFDTGGTTWGAAPTAANNLVYVGNNNGELFALSASTGQEVWSRDLGDAVTSAPVVAPGALYVGVFMGTGAPTYSLNPFTGATNWVSAEALAGLESPALAHDVLFQDPGFACNVQAVDAGSGAAVWLDHFCDEGDYSRAVAVAGGFVLDYSVGLHGLDPRTGEIRWTSYPLGYSPPSVANGVVFVAGTDLSALDLGTGTLLWRRVMSGYNVSSPAIANDVVYQGQGDGTIRAYNVSTAAQLWISPVAGANFDANPAVSDGTLFSATADGMVYAFGLP